MDSSRQPGVQIDQVIVSRCLFEHGQLAFDAPIGSKPPEIQFSIEYQVRAIAGDDTRLMGVLHVKSAPEDPFFYRVNVELMAFVSVVRGEENMPLLEYAKAPLVSTLYPFAREAIASITGRGRHGSVYLKPFNFQAAVDAASREKSSEVEHPAPVAHERLEEN